MHYKSFEELYGKQTTEDHRPSLKDTKTKIKGKMKITKTKHTMPFCPSAARAKNVGITVNCVECEKPRLLFSANKLTEKDRIMLRGFLDTIFYTCGMPFHNTCDLAIAVPPQRPDDDLENEANDHEIIDEVDDSNENEQDEDSDGTIEPDDSENEKEDSDNNEEEEHEEKEDSIREIFSRVFVNDSWTCASQVEKPYFSAGIYPDVCIECGNLNVSRVEKEHPRCNDCSGNTSVSKKRLRWKQGGKDKGKRKVV